MAGVQVRDYQYDAINNMRNGCILNGGVGVGKSRTALAYYYILNGGEVNTPSGFEYVNKLISGSNDIMPLDDANKRLYKRLYHNLPYLIKTKGTVPGLRALITAYGIPDTILRINEFVAPSICGKV